MKQMRTTEKSQGRNKFLLGLLTFALALVCGLTMDVFAIVSRASQGKVTATNGANIRKEASTKSEAVTKVEKNKVVTINGQVQGSDNFIWYQITVDGTEGYIRSDLVTVTDEATPGTTTQPGGDATDVTKVNPVDAVVETSNKQNARVRKEPSTSSTIVASASNGISLTVTGTAQGKDGQTWYQVSYSTGGSEVTGFVRHDFVKLSGELTPYEEPSDDPPVVDDPPVADDPVVEPTKDFETREVDGVWWLIDMTKQQQYDIQKDLFDVVKSNKSAYDAAVKAGNTLKVVIVILILLLVAAGAFIGLLIFKLRDMNDDAYFRQVERETIKRRSAERPAGQRPAGQGAGVRPAGQGSTRPAGQNPGARPAGQNPGTRPAGQNPGARPAGQNPGTRPAGQNPGARPAGQNPGARPAGQNPGARPGGQNPGVRPMGQNPGARPAGQGAGARPGGQNPGARPAGHGGQGPAAGQQRHNVQSKNFLNDDDDEFEFEFLNYDEEDGK